nr:unnamed protein product [Digitaria exilis]
MLVVDPLLDVPDGGEATQANPARALYTRHAHGQTRQQATHNPWVLPPFGYPHWGLYLSLQASIGVKIPAAEDEELEATLEEELEAAPPPLTAGEEEAEVGEDLLSSGHGDGDGSAERCAELEDCVSQLLLLPCTLAAAPPLHGLEASCSLLAQSAGPRERKASRLPTQQQLGRGRTGGGEAAERARRGRGFWIDGDRFTGAHSLPPDASGDSEPNRRQAAKIPRTQPPKCSETAAAAAASLSGHPSAGAAERKAPPPWCVYLIASSRVPRTYVGVTTDFPRR